MFGAAIIVFREVLEAALLIGIIAASTRGLTGRGRWLGLGIGAGLVLSLVVAALTDVIAQWADGAGQELFNVGILGIAVVMLAWHNIWMSLHGKELAMNAKRVAGAVASGQSELSAIALVVALTILREGSETSLFLYGLASGSQLSTSAVLAGMAIGIVGGILAGTMLYAGLLRIPLRWLFGVTSALVLLLASGMAGQMGRLLIQGGILSYADGTLWDTSSVLSLNSVAGNLLHVLMGYEPRPSGLQVLFYVITFIVILVGMIWSSRAQGHSGSKSLHPA